MMLLLRTWLPVFAVFLLMSCDFFKAGSSGEKKETETSAPDSSGLARDQGAGTPARVGEDAPLPDVSWEDVKEGSGDSVSRDSSLLKVRYKVWLKDSGNLVEDSSNREEGFSFTLGDGNVIPGWDQGLAGMKKGGIRRLEVPPSLAYGKRGISGLVPPDATLIFEIELLDLKDP